MTPLLIANWKMQLDDAESVATAQQIAATLPADVRVVLCPSFVALRDVARAIAGTSVLLGAQDCSWEVRGAHTGEVSPADLRAAGCTYVLVGHSERRQELGETDAMVARKLTAALHTGLTPVLCVGETWAQRERGATAAVIHAQVAAALAGVTIAGTQELVVAYEPVWAIGTGHAAVPEDVASAVLVAEGAVAPLDEATRARIRFTYGGSVDPGNIHSFLTDGRVSGFLVGTASQTAARLRNLIAAMRAS